MRGFHEPFKLLDSDDLSILHPVWREIVLMAANGARYQRIADSLYKPVGTVKSRLSRARAKIIAARQPKIVGEVEIAQL